MARPVETAFAYFPLDCTFFSNDKVKALRRAYGSIGVLTYIYILCTVYGNGYYYKVKNLDQFAYDIAESIANKQLESVAARVRESIDYMADGVDLIDRSCLDMGILTSRSIQEQYSATIAKFKRKTQIKEYNLLTPIEHLPKSTVNSEETVVNSEKTHINSEKTPRKRKGKRKEEISLTRDKELPTLEEIKAYCKERNNRVDPQRFFDYYSANGWMIGRSPMLDWRAAVRRWETNGFNDESHSKQSRYTDNELNALFTIYDDTDDE